MRETKVRQEGGPGGGGGESHMVRSDSGHKHDDD
jgi:hypothetical protein